MSRHPARFTQADVARAARAAKDVGGLEVVVDRNGNIILRPSTGSPQETAPAEVEKRPEVVL